MTIAEYIDMTLVHNPFFRYGNSVQLTADNHALTDDI